MLLKDSFIRCGLGVRRVADPRARVGLFFGLQRAFDMGELLLQHLPRHTAGPALRKEEKPAPVPTWA